MTVGTHAALAERLVGFAGALRQHGVSPGTSEVADAARVTQVLGLERREALRSGLAAALLRRAEQRPVFDQLFDLYFPAATGARSDIADTGIDGSDIHDIEDTDNLRTAPEATPSRERIAALREALARALAADDAAALDRLAALVTDQLGTLRDRSGFSAAQALERLGPQTAISRAHALRSTTQVPGPGGGSSGPGSTPGSGGGADGLGPLGDRLTRQEIRAGVAAFRRRVETEARRCNAEVRGTDRIARHAVTDPVERRDFLLSGPRDLVELRAAVDPLAKRLAAALSLQRRRHARGHIDLRRTLRRSLSTGGIPIDPAYRVRPPRRPDLVLLCDVSGSVAGFSAFTMALMQALATQFRRLRVFAFVSTTDEITDMVTAADALPDGVVTTALRTRRVLGWGASSSYGQALDSFTDQFLDAVGPRTTVLVLGDARSNYGLPRLPALRAIRDQARRVIWLNPEPASSWDTGDSLAGQYAQVVDMHECRNVEQLRTFVTRVLAG